jgi:hypothetical protein
MSMHPATGRGFPARSGVCPPLLESRVFAQILLVFCTVAAGVLIRIESLAALGVPRMLGVIAVTLVIVSTLFAVSFALAERVLRARRRRKIDATAAWFIRYYEQLLDEALNPNRRHPDGAR